MTEYVEKTNIITTHVAVPKELNDFFLNWQSELNEAIAKFPGFISLEILSPESLKIPSWTLVQRFADSESATAWYESEERKKLFSQLKSQETDLQIDEKSISEPTEGVTEVIITKVAPEKKESFKKWLAKIHLAESKFPGFRGMHVQSPGDNVNQHWVTLLEFDSVENLDRWLSSDVRKEIVKELDPMITSLETHRIISPFAGWFSSIARVADIPPAWKQTMLVLLVLFPIVMLELKFLRPVTKELDISLATFIGNAISVTLISWPLMPFVIRCFKFWLYPGVSKSHWLGTLILIAIYLLEIFIFWGFI